jgi:hypothetical protein
MSSVLDHSNSARRIKLIWWPQVADANHIVVVLETVRNLLILPLQDSDAVNAMYA